MATESVDTPCGKCVFLKRLFFNASPNTTSRYEAHPPVTCIFILLRIDGYRFEDKLSLQKAANNVEVAKRLTSTFPHPYTENNAESWIEFTKIKNEHQESEDNFILPIVTVTGIYWKGSTTDRILSPKITHDNNND